MTNVGSIDELKFDRGTRETVTLTIGSRLSEAILMPNAGPLVLYREVPPPAGSIPGTKPTKQTMATVALPSDMEKAIVVILPKSPAAYAAMVFDDSAKTHPRGTVKVFNLSNMPSALSLNKNVYPVAQGKSELAPYPTGPINIQVAVQKGSNWGIALDNGRIGRANLRAHVFVFNYIKDPTLDDGQGVPPPALVRFYTESAPSPEPEGVSVTAR